MNNQLKNLLIGMFILSAIALVVSIVMFLKPSVGDMKQTLNVRFSDINRIDVGTRVLFAGKPVGEVVAINQIYDARDQPTDSLGRVYFYQLTLKVDSAVKVYNTDEIAIQTSGLLGERSISIIPRAPPKGVVPLLIKNKPIYAESIDPLENALSELSELAKDMQDAFRNVTIWIKDHGEEMASTIKAAGSALEEIDRAVTSVNQTQLIDELHKGTQNFNLTLTQFQKAMEDLEKENAFKNAGITIGNLNTISKDIADSKGTLGKLIGEDDLYLRLNAILSKADTMMNDINHYGILFHLNKGWQRTRLQRVNLLNALNTPANFKTYFTQEVDQINMSMSRLSMLIDKADQNPEKETILNSDTFQKNFSELLRQADELSENLRLYNQQLNGIQER